MQRDVETFLLLLLSALCMSTDGPKLILGSVFKPLSHFSKLLHGMPASRGESRMGSRMTEIKSVSHFSISCPALLCKSPNLEPPDCNQIHSAQQRGIRVLWMKLSFWAITWIFSVVGECVTVTLGGTQGRHTQRGCDERGAGNCSCHGEGVLMERLTVTLGVCQSPCSWGEQELLPQRESPASLCSLHNLYMQW